MPKRAKSPVDETMRLRRLGMSEILKRLNDEQIQTAADFEASNITDNGAVAVNASDAAGTVEAAGAAAVAVAVNDSDEQHVKKSKTNAIRPLMGDIVESVAKRW